MVCALKTHGRSIVLLHKYCIYGLLYAENVHVYSMDYAVGFCLRCFQKGIC